jgi:hypothetical protein
VTLDRIGFVVFIVCVFAAGVIIILQGAGA